ncbi:MAG: hypothetical protein CMF96_03785 [Candidatus Marinimicrobia bacterium]|nr:hypothetical protein [Candidatus Neomarinimicrobiota bacterium]|tara:strand:+ start:1911 stop:2618 length:708 start_codon:yes stop_codon:yes gene_type:complete
MTENKKFSLEYLSYRLPYYGVIIFIIFNFIAMILYPGGTYQNPDLEIYKFTQNYFSDLGRTLTMDQTQNFFSSFIFNNSLLMIGILFGLFYYFLPNLFICNSSAHLLSKIASGIAITSGIAFAGVGLTPSDLYLDGHMFFVRWAFRSFFIASVIFIIAIYKAEEWDNKYSIIYIGFTLILLLYILIMDFGPKGKESMQGLIIQVVAQKTIAMAFIISVYMKSKGALEIYKQKTLN